MPSRAALSVASLKTFAHGVLGWVWIISLTVALLCALPWFEFANPEHIWPTIAIAFLLTLTGYGPDYFAARTASDWVRRVLGQIKPNIWAIVKRLIKLTVGLGLLTVPVSCVIGLYALVPWGALLMLLPNRSGNELVLFKRGSASIQFRPTLSGGHKSVIVRPLLPGLNFRTNLPSDQPDSTWAAFYPPVLAPDYVHYKARDQQIALLEGVAIYQQRAANSQQVKALKAAQEIHNEKINEVRGLNTIHFVLDASSNSLNGNSLNGPRGIRSPRPLAGDIYSSSEFYAQLSSERVLWMRILVTATETFSLTLPGFRGQGLYELGSPPTDGAPTLFSSGYAQLSRYDTGIVTTYTSLSAAPVRLTITRHDLVRHLIAGRFEGTLLTDGGKWVSLKDGAFEIRYDWPPAPTTSSLSTSRR